ncbi:MAG: hypothetical protein RBR41_03075 [Desulfovibrio sp.]|uniref:DUF4376 domain-containing protein n=1 Tax=Desulfovibrio sp. TaxID=885 RepID=UPI002A3588CE|nr:hypothetical protein [Desulfovibrio sp.]MDY0258633.1 hypothetical protein [Desulfovibrio sp.]
MVAVTVVPNDKLISVGGVPLVFDFPAPQNLHALQWDGQQGHMEWIDDFNWPLMASDATAYTDEVAPYVALWQTEKERLEQEAATRAAENAATEAARLAEYNKPENAAARKIAAIDAETSATIVAGFDNEIGGETLHFSYDSFDQQNFADSANVAQLVIAGGEGLPTDVVWNAYRNFSPESKGELVRLKLGPAVFIALYMSALAHKAACMERGGQRKVAVAEALERGATAEEIEAI